MTTAIVIPLFERHSNLPYCGMVMLHAISLRRLHADVPLVICDYSRSAEVQRALSRWRPLLRFDVQEFSIRRDVAEFTLHDALSLRYDAILQLARLCAYDKLICVEADMLATGPVLSLAEGDYHARFIDRSGSVSEGAAVSDCLLVLNMASESALRLVALTRSLHQEHYVWGHLRGLTVSGASGYSERLLEVAIRLLDRDGFGHITWREYESCYVHYARHNKKKHHRILGLARSMLDERGYKDRFVADFGELEPLIFREASDVSGYPVQDAGTP
jgi:hypothetical protein